MSESFNTNSNNQDAESSFWATNVHERVNGGLIKFRTKYCKCGQKALVFICESSNNPNTLFFKCKIKDRGGVGCKYLVPWVPDRWELDPDSAMTFFRRNDVDADSGIHADIGAHNVVGLRSEMKEMEGKVKKMGVGLRSEMKEMQSKPKKMELLFYVAIVYMANVYLRGL